MKDIVYNFLDDYVGKGRVNVCKYTFNGSCSNTYEVRSDNGIFILLFNVGNNEVRVYDSEGVCRIIEGYFSIDQRESLDFIRDWFAEKYNIKVHIRFI